MDTTQITTADILHCRGNRWLARLIMFFTRSKFSHSAIAIRVNGNLFVVDAQKDGINLRPFESWHAKYNYKIEVQRMMMNPTKCRIVEKRALSKIGMTSYDFESLVISQPIHLLTGKWVNDDKDQAEKMTCSEFVAWCFQIDNFYKMTPRDLYEWCVINKSIFITNIN